MIANYIKYIIHIITSTKDFIRVNLRVTQIDNAAAVTSLQDSVKTIQIRENTSIVFLFGQSVPSLSDASKNLALCTSPDRLALLDNVSSSRDR